MTNSIKRTLIITCGGEKGGSGKSTVATNLAGFGLSKDLQILLIDADKQRSAANWAAKRNMNDSLKKIDCIEKLGSDLTHAIRVRAQQKGEDGNPLYDLIIVDTPGVEGKEFRCAAITSHKLITSFKTNSFDTWTSPTVAAVVEEINSCRPDSPLECLVLASMVTTHPKKQPIQMTKFLGHIEKKLKDFSLLKSIFHNRDAFAEAGGMGMAATEYAPESLAAQEVRNLFAEVVNV